MHYPQSPAATEQHLSNPSDHNLSVNKDIILYIYWEGISRLEKPCLFLLKNKVIKCPLECPMSILLTCPSVFIKWVIVSGSNLCMHTSICQKAKPQCWIWRSVGKISCLEPTTVFEHFFLYSVPYCCILPEKIKGEDDFFPLLICKWHGYVYLKWNKSVVFCFCLTGFYFNCTVEQRNTCMITSLFELFPQSINFNND